jgi:hypothetical protein
MYVEMKKTRWSGFPTVRAGRGTALFKRDNQTKAKETKEENKK